MGEQITIRDIAKMCGVGVSTVSRAINNHPDINEETRQLILNTIKKSGYVPNNSARNLKRTESQTIAVLVKGINNPFFSDIIRIIEKKIVAGGYSFLLQQVEEREDEIETAVSLEKEKRLKGVIFLGGIYTHPDRDFNKLTVPFVVSTVDVTIPESMKNGAAVSIDDMAESKAMTQYLLGRGYRRIALLAAPVDDESIGKCRLAGYLSALRAAGADPDEQLILHMPSDMQTYSVEVGYRMTKQLIASGADFDCVFAISDTMAVGACRALYEAGIKVPDDCGVAGFDGIDIGQYYCPSISTIQQPRDEIAERTVELLFEQLAGTDSKKLVKKAIFPAKLVARESTGKLVRGMKTQKD
ncbi:MAG: LacI family DNA-binding transcriptional regulator [Lachnospiraceae bacterium]|jgi:LacI family repressor for deo operon, udp, cdd, tsx, nupC, and nupG